MSAHSGPDRPRTVTIVILGVIFFGVWNLAKSIALWRQLTVLLSLNVQPDPRLRLILALLWALLFFSLALGLWYQRPFTRRAVPILLLLYALYDMGMWLFFQRPPLNKLSWFGVGLFYLGFITFTRWVLNRWQQ